MDIPHHIAIIMDGNGRWAKRRGLPRMAGHKQGMERVREIVKEAKRLGVKIVTFFAFSTENWNRPKREVHFLFSHMEGFLKKYKKELMREGIRLNVIGKRDRLNRRLVKRVQEIEMFTLKNNDFVFNIALDYGGRWDIIEAAKKIARDSKAKKIDERMLSEDIFRKYLSLREYSDPDLLIRTSGEQRISNFLLWHLAYSEIYFTSVLWPDFTAGELNRAIEVYSKRERRFGGL